MSLERPPPSLTESAMAAKPGVVVVTVTYGDRGEHVRELLEALTRQTASAVISRIIVIDNGALDRHRFGMPLGLADPRVDIVPMPGNTGSAGGFACGLELARDSEGCRLVWLLDDDNVPQPDALHELLDAWTTVEQDANASDLVTVGSVRPDRPAHRRILSGIPATVVFESPSSFMSFHIRDIWRKLASRISPPFRREPPATVAVPFAPYGGLSLRPELLNHIGLPDARLFTYADDTEFTYRITRRGGHVWLATRSRVREGIPSWDTARSTWPLPFRLILAGSDDRIASSVRNHVYFSKHFWRRHHTTYLINRWVFLAMLATIGLATCRLHRLWILRRAISEGERGDFGSGRTRRRRSDVAEASHT